MSTSPRYSKRKTPRVTASSNAADPAAPRSGKLPPLSQRLPTMSDYQRAAYRSSAARIGNDPGHPKHASAWEAIPLIEAEIRRRAVSLNARKRDAPA